MPYAFKEKQQEYSRRYQNANREKMRQSNKIWQLTNRDKFLAQKRKWYYKHRDEILEKLKIAAHGVGREEFDRLFAAQDGKCAICHQKRKLVVDHCHSTNQVRGLLCYNCNTGLGHLGDSLEGLTAALDYLREVSQ